MPRRPLGRSELVIESLVFGGNVFGWTLEEDKAFAVLDAYVDHGFTAIDTANTYGKGKSETIIGKWMKARGNRDSIHLFTKLGSEMSPTDKGLAGSYVPQAFEASLERLQTDYVDLYQCHKPDPETPLEETMEALDTLVRQGKVRYIGCSNFSGWHIMKALGVSERDRRERFVSQQIHYTLEARDAENELVPISLDQGLGILVWSPIAGGLLSGKHRRNQATPEGTRQFAGWTEPPIRDENRLWNIVDTLVEIAEGRGVSAAQVALAWLIGRKGVTSVIIGGRTKAQFKDNLASAELKLTDEERKRLDDISLQPLMYPYWHQRNTASDRLSEADLSLIGPHLTK